MKFRYKFFFYISIFSLIFSCENEFKECCRKENLNLIFHERKLEDGQEIDWIQCKGKNSEQIEFKIIDGKIRKKLNKLNDSIYVSTVFEEKDEAFLVDTLLIKDQKTFKIKWSWQKDHTYLGERIVLRENFRFKDSSSINQEKVYYNNRIDMDSSLFFTFKNQDARNYRLNIYVPLYLPEKVLNNISIVLKISDEIKDDFSNVEKINNFEVYYPYVDSGVYWILPKKRIKGVIELFSIIDADKGVYFNKNVYINKQ